MKRVLLSGVLVAIVATLGFAQLGTAPSGFQSYESEEMMLALYYPGNWFVVEEDGNLGLVNREALMEQLNAEVPDVQPGDVIMAVGFIPTFFLGMMGVPIDSTEALVDGMFETMLESNEGVTENDREILRYGGAQIGTVSFSDPAQDISGLFLLAHQQDEVVVFAMAAGMLEDVTRERETLAQVVSTVEFTGTIDELMGNM